jgi:spermidine synthase
LTVSRSQDFEGSLASTPYLPWIVLLFVGSGCAALVYEIVWFQLLQLIIGSSAISLAVLLSTFMGGMCIGSLGLARFVSARPHPLRVYALLEAAIGVWGVLVLFGLPWVGGLYLAIGGPGIAGLLFRGLLCALFLLPPTILMGATLPAIARWVRATPRGVSWLGFFYGGNTAGAVAGCLLAGFYLLRVHDVVFATFAAVGINAVVTVAGLLLARWTPHESMAAEGAVEGNPEGGGGGTMETAAPAGGAGPGEGGAGRFELAPGGRLVLVAIALSGMTALGSEVVWTRLLSLSLGATVYTFSIILAAFLLGIGLGSAAGSAWARSVKDARRALGWCQLGGAGVGGLLRDRGHPPLAGGPHPRDRRVREVRLPVRPGALPRVRPARCLLLGRELPAGPGGGGVPRAGSRAPGGPGLRRQHPGRHRGRSGRPVASDRLARDPAHPTGPDGDGDPERAAPVGAGLP